MKQFINDDKTYSLDEVNNLLTKFDEEDASYRVVTENVKPSPLKNKTYISAVLFASLLTSPNYAMTNKVNSDRNDYLSDLVTIDSEHNQYVDFLKSHANLGIQKRQMITEQILSFKSLSNNWDGYGAIPTEVSSASNAIILVQNLIPSIVNKITSVHPTTNGTVSFVWENKDNERVSFEIGDNNYSFYTKLNNLKPLFFKGFVQDMGWTKLLEQEVKKL